MEKTEVRSQKTKAEGQIDRIIVIVEAPLTRRDYARFGVESFLSHARSVEVWDCSAIINPAMTAAAPQSSVSHFSGLHIFRRRRELLSSIRALTERDVVLNIVDYRWNTVWMFRAMSQVAAYWGSMVLGGLPPFTQYEPVAARVKRVFTNPMRLRHHLTHYISPGTLGIRPYDFFLFGGQAARGGCQLLGERTQLISAHSMDYDLFLGLPPKSESTGTEKLFVFLDQFVPFHPDWESFGSRPPCTAEMYYADVRNFFDRVETELSGRVVIAAHPRSNYEEHPGYFAGREIVKGKTQELVRAAQIVFAHESTAVTFANLYSKPVVYMNLSSFIGTSYDARIEMMAKEFGKRSINISNVTQLDWEKELGIDSVSYERYRRLYIKEPGTSERSVWEVFIDAIKGRCVNDEMLGAKQE